MNVLLPKKEKLNTKSIIIYTVSIIVCIIAVVIVCFASYYGSEELDRLITIGGSSLNQEDIDYQLLVSNFDNIIQNQLEDYSTNVEIKKIDENQNVVYTYYSKDETKKDSYDLNLNIPYINIDNETIQKFNDEIKETFEQKAESALASENQNIIYSVQYEATIEDDILSLIIRANLKQNTDAQRTIIQTYNYDLRNNKEITLQDMINNRNYNVADVQDRITGEIETQQKRVSDLNSLGYSIFERDPDNDMYKVENSDVFFIKDGNIYIIYAYGNENLTSEMDLVII